MRITATQLRILRTIQSHPTLTRPEIADRLQLPGWRAVCYELNQFAKDNGMNGYRWFIEHLADYDLSTLIPYRQRPGAIGIHYRKRWRVWFAKVGRWCSPAYHFRSAAVEARAMMLRALAS